MIIWPTPRPAVLAAIDILQTAFGAVEVGTRYPSGTARPDQFVRVSRIGGNQPNPRFEMCRVLVECWATTYGTAENMTCTARAALRNAAGTVVADDIFIHWYGNESGPVDYDDPEVPSHRRRQFTGDLQVSTRTVS